MLPRVLNIPVKEMTPLPSAAFFRELKERDMVLAFPVFWKSFLEMCSGRFGLACPGDIHGVTSGAPCPPEIIEGLLAAPLLNGMTEIYGTTEFGAVGIRRLCRGTYRLLAHWHRVPLGSREWGIARNAGSGMSLPDTLDWRDDRSFIPLRRKDHAVQVGGTNVFPVRIADILRGHPKVNDCAVRLMRPEEGSRLKAFVVPAKGVSFGPLLARELREWLGARLEPASMPKSISFGPGLPRTFSGKLADWSIAGEIKAPAEDEACAEKRP
jgi:4-coumarate--CoA ligase (photoactive yellow protein activation family)